MNRFQAVRPSSLRLSISGLDIAEPIKSAGDPSLMQRFDVFSTVRVCGAPPENRAASATQVYRLKSSITGVQFNVAPKGRLVFLPKGAELRVVGASRLPECIEVMHDNRLYNIFKADLLGPRTSRIAPIAVMAAMGACA